MPIQKQGNNYIRYKKYANRIYINMIYVDYKERKQGIGTAMLKDFIAKYSDCVIELTPVGDEDFSQKELEAWYIKHGFKKVKGDLYAYNP